ncbi:MAG: D-tyrosyl-tRNA(Tyr) deacylase [Deltaproteobacteria bacterium]|nr:D-tyrosyl-tRNA(Tyr) deacylase [Deltaproteobacteria bacterium]
MRAVVQRARRARVVVGGEVVGALADGAPGLVVLLGAGQGDNEQDAEGLADKVVGLRVFEDADGKMNLGLEDVAGSLLVVSQFTLFGDCRKGRRPSFIEALEPVRAEALVEVFVRRARTRIAHVATGRFQAHMEVELVNDGPVTLLLDSKKTF